MDDSSQTVLAMPGGISVRGDGSLLVADFSDKNIKLYDPAGRRTGTVGAAGRGPGEFASLFSAATYGDSIVGYDVGNGLTVFSPEGRYARLLKVRDGDPREVMAVRVLDDSLFLLVGAPMGGVRRDLLAIIRPDGTRVSSFFNQSRYFEGRRELSQYVGVEADGRGGVVYAALVGGDSVYAFDYAGHQLAAAPADPRRPLATTRALLAANHDRPRKPNGEWAFHNNREVFRVVALDSATAVLHVAPYNTQGGTDLVEGGTLLAVSLVNGQLRHLARTEAGAGLYGRDRAGNALLIGYADAEHEHYRVSRLSLAPRGGR
ncbi:MAG TPA: hypothetical protein VJT67_11805 [Longimicrobiaceae bacterium]|nr:hypothetical protein [Longimicrobiaceae bacterium]